MSISTPSASTRKVAIERVVALLTPLFVAAGGAISTGAGSATGIPSKDYVALFVAGATAALSAVVTWLLGRQKFVHFTDDARGLVEKMAHDVAANQQAGPALADIEEILQTHTAAIVSAVGSAVHAPPSVEQIVQQMAAQLGGGVSTVAVGASAPVTSSPAPTVPPAPVA